MMISGPGWALIGWTEREQAKHILRLVTCCGACQRKIYEIYTCIVYICNKKPTPYKGNWHGILSQSIWVDLAFHLLSELDIVHLKDEKLVAPFKSNRTSLFQAY